MQRAALDMRLNAIYAQFSPSLVMALSRRGDCSITASVALVSAFLAFSLPRLPHSSRFHNKHAPFIHACW